ncbi:MAG: hypothetical protein AAF518_15690 [Spirochaetota bacterium]
MNETELQKEFDAIRKLRGKKREQALKDFQNHGEVLLPWLDKAMEDKNASARKLALGIFQTIVPKTQKAKGVLSEKLAEMLASSKPTQRTVALAYLEDSKVVLPGLEKALQEVAVRNVEEDSLLRLIPITQKHVSDTKEILAILEPLQDSWSQKVGAAAGKVITKEGGKLRPSIWEGAPIAQGLVKEIQRLGGVPTGKFDPVEKRSLLDSFYSRQHGSWQETDPLGEFKDIPPAIHYLDTKINWQRGRNFKRRIYGDLREITICGASENFDTTVDTKRVLLYVIDYDELSQFYSAVNLLDPSNDPAVYSIDHDGSDPYKKERTLSSYLSGFWL